MKSPSFRNHLLPLALPLATLLQVAATAPAWAESGLSPLLPNAVSENGQRLYNLYLYQITPFAILVFLLVEGLILTVIIRFRRSKQPPGYTPPQWHSNLRLEIAWTLGPVLVLIFIGIFSFVELQRDFVKPADSVTDLDITVSAHQYGWVYSYPEGFQVKSDGLNPVAMVIPTNKLVRLRIQSTDVIHSFWVPELTGKTDAVPGYDNFSWVKVGQTGEWRGECAELCGAGHYTMQIRVKAVSEADYEAWRNLQMEAAQAAAHPSPSPQAVAASPSPAASAAPTPAP
jgi:cytochrome c oxidase subunit 2